MVIMQALIFLAVLSVVVLIHEGGHFLTARLFDIKVEEFGFGLPPRLTRLFKKGETEYTLNWLPIGGFVKLFGEDGLEEEVEDKRAFGSKPIWQRAVVLTAGVLGNFILAVVLFGVVYSVLGIPTPIEGVEIVGIADDSPAAKAGLEEGMMVEELVVGEEKMGVESVASLVEEVDKNKGEEIGLWVEKEGERQLVKLTPREESPEDEGPLGVVIVDSELVKYPFWQMPFRGVWVGFKEALAWGGQIVLWLKELVVQLVTGQGVEAEKLAGPVGIYQATGRASKMGIWFLLQFVGVFSVNLAIVNLLPFPALDGGRILLLGVEALRGEKLEAKVEQWINALGMMLVLGLMLVVTLNDIARLVGGWQKLWVKLWWWF